MNKSLWKEKKQNKIYGKLAISNACSNIVANYYVLASHNFTRKPIVRQTGLMSFINEMQDFLRAFFFIYFFSFLFSWNQFYCNNVWFGWLLLKPVCYDFIFPFQAQFTLACPMAGFIAHAFICGNTIFSLSILVQWHKICMYVYMYACFVNKLLRGRR